jgi:F-type H+-transporting ATPase subunit delta
LKNLAVSGRYAKALMLIGKDDGLAEQYREELDGLAGFMDREVELKQAICNPLYDRAGRKNLLDTVLDKLELSVAMRSFVRLLFDKGRFAFLSDINEFYRTLADELKGVAHASVISATELSSEALEKIQNSLSKLTGKDIILDVEQDPGLIGGIVTKIGDLVLDGSVKTQLLGMRESFKRGESV